jgi:hypothetical protein
MIVPICLAVVVACVLAAWSLDRRHARQLCRFRKHVRHVLEQSGLQVVQEPPRWQLTRSDGRLVVEAPARQPLPGSGRSGEDGPTRVEVTLVSFDDPRPDLFCASHAHVLEALGPVTSVSKQTTSDAAFDARFEVRSEAPMLLTPPVAAGLIGLGLAWVYRRDGRTQLAFERADITDLPTVLDVVERFGAPSEGYRGAVRDSPLRPALQLPVPREPPSPLTAVQVSLGIALFTSPFSIAVAHGPLCTLFADVACPSSTLREVSLSDGGASYGLTCADGSSVSDWVLAAAPLFWCACALTIGTALSVRAARSSQPTHASMSRT